MKVSVTVDDLGISDAVNASAERLAETGVVERMSVLASGRELDGAIGIALASGVEVSAHLNCIQPPFLAEEELPSSPLAWLVHSGRLSKRAENEWRAQIRKLLDSGVSPSRLDSHRHIHHTGPLRRVIVDLALEFGIPSVRAAVLPERWDGPRCFLLDMMGRKLRKLAETSGIRTDDLMLGFPVSGNLTMEYLRSTEKRISGPGSAELVTHPSLEPVWSAAQPEEHGLLESDRFRKWIEER